MALYYRPAELRASLQIPDELSLTICGSHRKERHHLQRQIIAHAGQKQNEMILGREYLLYQRTLIPPAASQRVWRVRKKPVWSIKMSEWLIVLETPPPCGAVWSMTWSVVTHKKVRVLDMLFSGLCQIHLTIWICCPNFKALDNIAWRRTSPVTQRLCVCTETPWPWSWSGSNRPLTAEKRYKKVQHCH